MVKGRLTAAASPWARMLLQDLQQAARFDKDIQDDIDKYGVHCMTKSHAFLTFKRRQVLSYELLHEPEHAADQSFECRVCARMFSTHAGLNMHMFKGHNMQRAVFQFVISNECPICRVLFSSIRTTRLHLARFFPEPCRPKRTHDYKYTLRHPRSLMCHRCRCVFGSYGELLEHMQKHLQQLARDGKLG